MATEKMLNSFDVQDSIAEDDIVLGYDKSENKVKNFKFGTGIWNWIVGKLATAVVSKLTTTDKTMIGAINELNSNAKIDTSTINYSDNELLSLGSIDGCVKDSVDKNKFPTNGIFFKEFIAGVHYLAIGYRYVSGAYGTIILYCFDSGNDRRYVIENKVFKKLEIK